MNRINTWKLLQLLAEFVKIMIRKYSFLSMIVLFLLLPVAISVKTSRYYSVEVALNKFITAALLPQRWNKSFENWHSGLERSIDPSRFISERRQDDSCLLRFTLVCSQGVSKLTTQQTSHANDFVNAKCHARDKPLLAGYLTFLLVFHYK